MPDPISDKQNVFPGRAGWSLDATGAAASREILVQEADGEKRYIKVTVRSTSSDRLRDLMAKVDRENAGLIELSKAYDIGGAIKSLKLTKNADNEEVISTKSKDNRIQEHRITDLTRQLASLSTHRPEYRQYKLIVGIYKRLYSPEPEQAKPLPSPPSPRPSPLPSPRPLSKALDQSSSIELELDRVVPGHPPAPSPSSKKLMLSMTRLDDSSEEEDEDRPLLPKGSSSSELVQRRPVARKQQPTPAPKPIPSSVPRKKYDSTGKTGMVVFGKENPNIEAIEPVSDEANIFRSQISPEAERRPGWIKQKLTGDLFLPAVNLNKERLETQLINFEALYKPSFNIPGEHNSFQRMALKTSDQILIDTYAIGNPKQKDVPADKQKWIVCFHANKMGYEESLPSLNLIATHTGANILTGNYRGVGQSQGMPRNDQDLIEDGRTMVRMLLDSGVPPKNIVLEGLSAGGGVATALVAENPGMHLVNDRSFTSYTAAAGRISRFLGALAKFVTWLASYRLPSHHHYKRIENATGHVIALSNKVDDVVGEGARFPEGLNLTEATSPEDIHKESGKGKPLRVHIDLKMRPDESRERVIPMSNMTYLGLEAHISPLIDQISDPRKGDFIINRIQPEYPTYVAAIQTALDLPRVPVPRQVRDQINRTHLNTLKFKLNEAKNNYQQKTQAKEEFVAKIDISSYSRQELIAYLAESTGEKLPLSTYLINAVNRRYKALLDKALAAATEANARRNAHLDYLNRILFQSNADSAMLTAELRRALNLGNGPLPDYVIRAVNRRYAEELSATSKGVEAVVLKQQQMAMLPKLLMPGSGDLAPALREGLNLDTSTPLPSFLTNFIEEQRMERALKGTDDPDEIQIHLERFLTTARLPQQTAEEQWVDLQEFWKDFQRRLGEVEGPIGQIKRDLNRSRYFQNNVMIFNNEEDTNTPKVNEICDQFADILSKPVSEQLLYLNTQSRIAGITKHLVAELGQRFDVSNEKDQFKFVYNLNVAPEELSATTLLVFAITEKGTREPILGYIPVKLTTHIKLPKDFDPHNNQYDLSKMEQQVESTIAPVMRDPDQVKRWLNNAFPL
jgi:hypothetical protein